LKYKNYILKVGQQASSSSRIKYGGKPQIGGLNKVPSSPDPIHNSKIETVDDENKSQIGGLRKVPSSPDPIHDSDIDSFGTKNNP